MIHSHISAMAPLWHCYDLYWAKQQPIIRYQPWDQHPKPRARPLWGWAWWEVTWSWEKYLWSKSQWLQGLRNNWIKKISSILKYIKNVSTLLSLSLWRTVFLLVLHLSADSRDLGESQHVLRLPPGVRRATPHVEWNSTKSQSKLGMSRLDLTDLTIKPRDEIQRHQPNVYIHQWGYHQKYLQHTGQWTCKWQNIAKDKHANDQINGGRPQTQCFPWDLTANHSGLFGVTIYLTTNKCGDWKILQTYQIPYDLH